MEEKKEKEKKEWCMVSRQIRARDGRIRKLGRPKRPMDAQSGYRQIGTELRRDEKNMGLRLFGIHRKLKKP